MQPISPFFLHYVVFQELIAACLVSVICKGQNKKSAFRYKNNASYLHICMYLFNMSLPKNNVLVPCIRSTSTSVFMSFLYNKAIKVSPNPKMNFKKRATFTYTHMYPFYACLFPKPYKLFQQ